MAKGQQVFEERRPGLRAKACRDGKKTLSEAFYALDDPLEAAVYSVLVEIMKELSDQKDSH